MQSLTKSYRSPVSRIRNPFVRGILYGVGLSCSFVSIVVATHDVLAELSLRALTILVGGLATLTALGIQAFRVARTENRE